MDWLVSDYKNFKSEKDLVKKFNRGGRDMSSMLDAQIEKKIDSWAIRWCYSQFKSNMLTVYPRVSRVKNIGLDGSGTHSGISSRYDANLSSSIKRCEFDYPELNDKIIKIF
ncbi:hypothetical protein ACFTAO_37290 [Paenibacillus rhizoplanae]